MDPLRESNILSSPIASVVLGRWGDCLKRPIVWSVFELYVYGIEGVAIASQL
jgi:hypothetical protein